MVGSVGNTEIAKSILDGKFEYNYLISDTMKDIIDKLKQKNGVQREDFKLFSRENYRKGWRRAKVHTSSGISGLQFGHWKSGFTNNHITDIYSMMLLIPYVTIYSPRC